MKRAWPAFLSKAADSAPVVQSSSQLEIPGGAKSFLRRVQSFQTMFNSFKLCPTHFSMGGPKFSRAPHPLLPPSYGPGPKTNDQHHQHVTTNAPPVMDLIINYVCFNHCQASYVVC